jgi:hypothetical protein
MPKSSQITRLPEDHDPGYDLMVADTSAVAAQSMPTYGSTWPSELELWMVCSSLHHDGGARLLDDCWNY